jgi:hypothetical protein
VSHPQTVVSAFLTAVSKDRVALSFPEGVDVGNLIREWKNRADKDVCSLMVCYFQLALTGGSN